MIWFRAGWRSRADAGTGAVGNAIADSMRTHVRCFRMGLKEAEYPGLCALRTRVRFAWAPERICLISVPSSDNKPVPALANQRSGG